MRRRGFLQAPRAIRIHVQVDDKFACNDDHAIQSRLNYFSSSVTTVITILPSVSIAVWLSVKHLFSLALDKNKLLIYMNALNKFSRWGDERQSCEHESIAFA